jgi:hypothetical protein
MPRSVCMFGNQKLILLHLFSDLAIFIAYTGIPLILMSIWSHFKVKGIPFADFFWKFAGFIFFCGITHLIGVINLYITLYWLDGAAKFMTAWFSVLVMRSLYIHAKKIKTVHTPEEYAKLGKTLQDLIDQFRNVSLKKIA